MQFLIYILVYPFLWIVSILPFRLLYAISDLLYILIFRVFGYRKKVVKENLRLVFPNKSKEEINLITKKFYHHLCDMMVEAIKSLSISEEEMKSRYKFTNIEEIHKLEQQNKRGAFQGEDVQNLASTRKILEKHEQHWNGMHGISWVKLQ